MNTLPDTGARSEFETGAVRDASEGKGHFHSIPPIALRAVARRFEDGAAKYEKNNWMKGIPLSRYYDSALRHLMAWSEGKTDEDHLAAVAWNAVAAYWTQDAIASGRLPASLMDLPYFAPAEVPHPSLSSAEHVPDVGEGYRWLESDEIIQEGDEFWVEDSCRNFAWHLTACPGTPAGDGAGPEDSARVYRRKVGGPA